MLGLRRNSKNKTDRKVAIAFANGYYQGTMTERERIITALLDDAVIITNVDVKALERVVEIVEG